MKRFLTILLWLTLAMGARAQDGVPDDVERLSAERFQILEGQVQSLKRDILGFSRDLHSLMKEALFPSETQVAIYISAGSNVAFQLSSLQISLDGKAVANRVYSPAENGALREGGVQRLFVGRVDPGKHKLTVSYLVTESEGRSFRGDQSFSFDKDGTAKVLEVTITGGSSGKQPELSLKEWRSS